jgi:hypothetical protein
VLRAAFIVTEKNNKTNALGELIPSPSHNKGLITHIFGANIPLKLTNGRSDIFSMPVKTCYEVLIKLFLYIFAPVSKPHFLRQKKY